MFCTGEGGDFRELPGGGFSHGCGRVFFFCLTGVSFYAKKIDNNENNHFTICRYAMLCCAMLWCVSIGPRRFEAG